jgi:hypothetical protein
MGIVFSSPTRLEGIACIYLAICGLEALDLSCRRNEVDFRGQRELEDIGDPQLRLELPPTFC